MPEFVLTPDMEKLLAALRGAYESEHSKGWGTVYLDNVKPEFTGRRLAGLLGALAKAGLYRELDGKFFGEVKLAD